MMIMNVQNSVQSNVCIIQIKFQPKLENIDKGFAKELEFKDIKFPVKIIDILKVEKANGIDVSVSGYENREKQLPLHL